MTGPTVDLLVETMGTDAEEVSILADGGRECDFRRLSKSLRGAAQQLVHDLAIEVMSSGQARQQRVESVAATVLGPTIAAVPVKGIGGSVFAVQVAPTIAKAEQSAAGLAVWEWEIGLDNLPPRLWLDQRWLDLTGTAMEFRDRVVMGPVDFFRPIARLSDILQIWQGLRAVKVGDTMSDRTIARTNTGELRQIHWAQRCVQTAAGPRVRGVCRDITGRSDPAQMHMDLIEMTLIEKLMHLQDKPGEDEPGVFAAVGDVTYPSAPTFIKWLTPYIPGLGHGVSTGQTPALHPDTLMALPGWLEQLKAGPITDRGKARRGGGGWLEVVFHGDILDRDLAPTIGVMIVYPADVSVAGSAKPGTAVPQDD